MHISENFVENILFLSYYAGDFFSFKILSVKKLIWKILHIETICFLYLIIIIV